MFRLGADIKIALHANQPTFGLASIVLRLWSRRRWRSIRLCQRLLRYAIADRMKLLSSTDCALC